MLFTVWLDLIESSVRLAKIVYVVAVVVTILVLLMAMLTSSLVDVDLMSAEVISWISSAGVR